MRSPRDQVVVGRRTLQRDGHTGGKAHDALSAAGNSSGADAVLGGTVAVGHGDGAALGGNVTLYDGSDGTARETLRQLVRRGWVRGGSDGAVTLENSLPSELPLSRRLLALPRED